MARTTQVIAAGPGDVDAGSGAGIHITVKDTNTGIPTTPAGTVTITGSSTSGGAAFWSFQKTLDALGEVYAYAVEDGPDTHWPLSNFDANGLTNPSGIYTPVPNVPAKYPGDVSSGRRSSDFATWFITVTYNGDATHAASSTQIQVNERRFGAGE